MHVWIDERGVDGNRVICIEYDIHALVLVLTFATACCYSVRSSFDSSLKKRKMFKFEIHPAGRLYITRSSKTVN